MAAICIVHSSDGASWFKYFSNYLQRVFSELNVESIRDTDLRHLAVPGSKVRNVILQSRINIFIVSPGYVHFLINNPEVAIPDSSSELGKTVVFLCGTTLDDFVMEDSSGQKIADRFPPYDRDRLLSYPDHDQMLERVVGSLELDSGSGRDETDTVGRKGKDAEMKPKSPPQKLNGKRKRKSKSFKFIPNQVRCEGTTLVVISFDELVAKEDKELNVEVEIEGDADADGAMKITAVWINPYTYSFTAPERRAGTLKASLFLQGKAIGSEDLEYTSPMMDAIAGLHLIYINQLNELFSFLKEKDLLTRDVDERMSKVLRDEANDPIPVAAFEYFHGVHRFHNSDVSDFELPTMFHLAAKFGLQELGRQLTDLPDARHSYCIYNSERKLPEDIANSCNHLELAAMFEDFREGDTFQQLYDSYIIMSRGHVSNQCNYLNTSRKADGEDSGDDYEDVPSELTFVNPFKVEEEKSSQLKDVEEVGMSSKNYVDELENPYECRFRKQLLVAPTRFIEGGPPTSIPRNQQELIGIMEQVKNKQLTMNDAEVLFREWQIRHTKKPASVKQKENQLAKIRQEAEKTQKKDAFTFPHFLGKKGGASSVNQCIPEIMPGTKQPKPGTYEVLKAVKPMKFEANTDRSSTTSSSSRESTCSLRSRASTTSGIDIDETIQEEVAPKLLPKPKSNNRHSVCLQKLEKELKSPGALEPPPLPPRVGGQPLPNVAKPISKQNRAVVAPEENSGNDSSPDDSYIDCELEPVNNSVTSDDMYMIMENPGKPPGDENNDRSKSMIHQESMPEFRNAPYVQQPRKSSLPTAAAPSSVPIPKFPFSRLPEEVVDSDSSLNPSYPPAKQFQLPKDVFKNVKLKKVQPQSQPTTTSTTKTELTSTASLPKSVLAGTVKPPPPTTKPTKVPPSAPHKNK